MKYLVAALAVACVGSAMARPTPPRPQSQSPAPVPPPPRVDLRRTLEQYHQGIPPAPRQLSPIERAELRRQLSEQAAPRRR